MVFCARAVEPIAEEKKNFSSSLEMADVKSVYIYDIILCSVCISGGARADVVWVRAVKTSFLEASFRRAKSGQL